MQVFRDGLFEGKVAFFTGGTSGIGLGIAERFAALGATVVLVGRKQEKMEAAVSEIRSRGQKADGHAVDVRDYAAMEGALGRTRETHGEIDILFCAAAGNFPAPVLGMSANGFKAVVDIDLLGTFNTCRAAYQYLRKPGASVISISANHAHVAYPLQAHVCAAKAGVDLLTKVLAMEWGPNGIRCNCITPGPIDGTEGMSRLAPTEESRQKVIQSVPLRRMGTKEDIANLAVFLCSDAASYISGAIYQCDGGQSLSGPRIVG
ncbi:MAG: SDR family oxidoreductase [Acidimicrobiia bacterium]|nr:SDR family oxidoreductase [Acidimicrobiia bacterium]